MQLALERYPEPFAAVVARSRVWVNGEDVEADHHLLESDEVAVIPPISGGG